MRLVLVDNFVMPDGLDPSFFDVHPHLGLTSLAAVAQRDGHEVAIYDPKREVRFGRRAYDRHFYQRAADDILTGAPHAVGFTTLGCSFLFAVRVAELIKRKEPSLPILLGGPHATMLDRQILETYSQFDIIVRHEAEETLPYVLAKLEQRAFDVIPGITWRAGREAGIRSTPGSPKIEDLDQLPIPLYDLYPVRDLGLSLMRVEAGRGCPFQCTFCSTASFFQRSYRLKSPERLVREMDHLHRRYGVTEFKLDHDLFTVDRRKVRAFCEVVQDRNYRWRVSARTDCVDEDLLESMAVAGCIGLYFGIETGSKRMQKIAEKRLKLDGVEGILDAAESLGIETTVSFITGYPEELREDQTATLDMLGRCFQRPQESCIPQLHILLPEPGTPMFAQHRQSLAYDGYVTKFNARLLSEGDLAQIQVHPDLYSTYYHYPTVLPRSTFTFTVDAVDALRVVGHDILSYALRFYQGRFSRLIAAFEHWMVEKRPSAIVDRSLAFDFISDTFGSGHHLTSLFRFSIALSSRADDGEPTVTSEREPHFDPDRLYEVSPRTCLLADIHNCSSLLERIRDLPKDAGPLEDTDAGTRTSYMVVGDGNSMTHYCIAPGVEAILDLFQVPRSVRQVAALLREITADAECDENRLGELVEIRALIPASEEYVASGSTC